MRLADKSLHILQHLSRRGSAWPEASSAAIRKLCVRMRHMPASGSGRESQSCTTSCEPHDSTLNQGHIHTSSTDTVPPCVPGLGSCLDSLSSKEDTETDNQRPTMDAFSLQDDFWCSFMGDDNTTSLTPDLDPFSSFDIPFWFDEEQHWDFMQ